MITENISDKTIRIETQSEFRQTLVDLVRRWGDANSDGILDARCKIFSVPEIEGVIGYRIEYGHAVVYGDPVCAPNDKSELALAFQKYCTEQKLHIIYTITSEEFSTWAAENLGYASIAFGAKVILDPQTHLLEKTGSKAVLLRKKVKKALKEGIIVKEYTGNDLQIERALEDVSTSWLNARTGFQIYMSKLRLFEDRVGKRWFYAVHEDKIVGLLLLTQLQSRHGWLFSSIMMTKNAPPGLSELFVISVLNQLENENCRYVAVGPFPSTKIGIIRGLGPLSEACTRWVYNLAKKVFRLEGHSTFWEKFQPQHEKSYLLFSSPKLRISSLRALLRGFNVNI